MRPIVFELCAETLDACLAARDGGAHRIELCSALSEGGLTPSHGLIRAAIDRSGLPVHVMVRPRGGDFVYSASELALMADDILHIKQLGAAGVVFGLLTPHGSVNIESTQKLVETARPMQVTFHRAFDEVRSLTEALEDVIATGCNRVLTSGGQPDVVSGAEQLAGLVAQSAGRIHVAAGGGLRLHNAAFIARATEAKHFHGSLRSIASAVAGSSYVVEASQVRAVVSLLRNA